MENARERDLKLGARRLPDVKLAAAPGGSPMPLRPPGRISPVLVLVDDAECDACRAWLHRLAAASDDIAEWDGRVIVVVPASPGQAIGIAGDAAKHFTVLADPDRTLAARLGISIPAVIIADQYGEIHHAAPGGDGHDLPEPAEVVGWLRYLAVQCPECQGEAL
ncbi:MAG TPA: redoxin domain-containing protein [Longimicrobium sp.]|nr:redoxin domain-containing protein [Longimicrobium sp.]